MEEEEEEVEPRAGDVTPDPKVAGFLPDSTEMAVAAVAVAVADDDAMIAVGHFSKIRTRSATEPRVKNGRIGMPVDVYS